MPETTTQPTNVDEINKYIQSLNEKQLMTIEIGKELLKDSFEIEKTIGFKQWKSKH